MLWKVVPSVEMRSRLVSLIGRSLKTVFMWSDVDVHDGLMCVVDY